MQLLFLCSVFFLPQRKELPKEQPAQSSSPGGIITRTLSQGPRARKAQPLTSGSSKSSIPGQFTSGQYQNRPYSVAVQASDASNYEGRDRWVPTRRNKGRFCNNGETDSLISKRLSGCYWHCIWHDKCRLLWQAFDIYQGCFWHCSRHDKCHVLCQAFDIYQGCFWHCTRHDKCCLSWQAFDIYRSYVSREARLPSSGSE